MKIIPGSPLAALAALYVVAALLTFQPNLAVITSLNNMLWQQA
ncbi:hypothetical protein [Alkalimonas amylolytica]|nr:hypothetical protein [Alkalimonas amylolytica]